MSKSVVTPVLSANFQETFRILLHQSHDLTFYVIVTALYLSSNANLVVATTSVHFQFIVIILCHILPSPGRVAQSVGHLTRKSGVLGSIPGLATYFRFSFRFFKKGSCQLLAKVCARSTG